MVQTAQTQTPAPLSDEQMDFFDHEGYLIVEDLLLWIAAQCVHPLRVLKDREHRGTVTCG